MLGRLTSPLDQGDTEKGVVRFRKGPRETEH